MSEACDGLQVVGMGRAESGPGILAVGEGEDRLLHVLADGHADRLVQAAP
jgi:hypothetical protein